MEENNQSTMMKWAVGIILTIAVITSGVFLFNKSKPSIDKAGSQLDNITVQIDNSQYVGYDAKEVSGSEVASVINTKATKDLTVTVKTKSSTAGLAYNSSSYSLTNNTNKDFIEPTARFTGAVIKTANGTVTGITFTQQ